MLSGAMTQSPDLAPLRTLAHRSESDIVAELRAALATSSASVEAVTRRGLDLIRKAKADGERETLVAQLKIGRAHVCTPVTNAHLVCRLLLEKKHQPRQTQGTTQTTT